MKKIKQIIEALNLNEQFDKANKFLDENNLTAKDAYQESFYSHKIDLESALKSFSDKLPGRKRVSIVTSLRSDYGKGKEIIIPDSQEKLYFDGTQKKYTNFYSVDYLKSIAKSLDLKLEVFEYKNSMINLALLIHIPESKKQSDNSESKEKIKASKFKKKPKTL